MATRCGISLDPRVMGRRVRATIAGDNGEEVAKVFAAALNTDPQLPRRPRGVRKQIKEQLVSETVRIAFVVAGGLTVAALLFWLGLR